MEENSGDKQSYIPQVRDNQKPNIGMKFESLEDAFSFYNQYAREAGFSARISNIKRSKKTNEVIWKKFVCFKKGHTDEIRRSKQAKSEEIIKERARGEIRSGCKSKISVVKEQNDLGWVVSTFMESHNHSLSTPSKVHLLRSHRIVSASEKALNQHFDEANSEKDKSSTFFFDYETDSDNRFSRCFWADPVSRRAYTVFVDVVVFDTTYNTNKYGMIFAPFVGVNHHHQTIVFGCGFLSDEKTGSFVWLLNKFL
ncbi:protein FAR1-RELATED SEQUENCE 5-like [Primulina tabacum]|uniref:protein FAR1-RELATED SEQUENCE 5-like n=1 Tax=Primulina tabacum TaxID=48773 RepID=UPI003F598043